MWIQFLIVFEEMKSISIFILVAVEFSVVFMQEPFREKIWGTINEESLRLSPT